MQTSMPTVQVNGQPMDVYLAAPDSMAPSAAIVVIQHAGGVDTFTKTMTERFAEAGYVAAAPELYHRLGAEVDPGQRRQQLKDPEIIDDVNATVDLLHSHSAVDEQRLGITGFCMGGRVVYLMAGVSSSFKAAVAFYGGNIMVPWGAVTEPPFAHTKALRCPLMFHFGEQDSNPSPEDMRELDAELTRFGKAHEFHTYAGAGHAFMNFTNPKSYRENAALTAWKRTLDFFSRHL
jgi:carboxymethylenebutenolidase